MTDAFYKIAEGGQDQVSLYWEAYFRTPGDFETPDWDMETRSIQDEYVPITIRAGRSSKVYPDFLSFGSLNFVSDRFRSFLSELGGAPAEFLPVNVLAKTGKPVGLNPYWHVHFLERPICIDYEKSDIDFWKSGGQIARRIRHLAIDPEKAHGRPIFMPLGLAMVFVSTGTAAQLRSANLNVHLTPVEKIRLGVLNDGTVPSKLH